jgi:hypothetical protein
LTFFISARSTTGRLVCAAALRPVAGFRAGNRLRVYIIALLKCAVIGCIWRKWIYKKILQNVMYKKLQNRVAKYSARDTVNLGPKAQVFDGQGI